MADIANFRYDRFLTQISVGYRNADYIAEKIAPVIPVSKRQGTYFEFGREAFRTHDTERAPSTRANEIDMEMVAKPFLAAGHALIGKLSDEERSESPDGYNPEPDLIEHVSDGVYLSHEKRVATAMRDVANMPNNVTLSGTSQFSVTRNADGTATSTGDPYGVFQTAMNSVRRMVGRRPNLAVIPYDVMRVLKIHPGMLAQLAANERKILTADVLKELLELDEILVPEVVEDTSNRYVRVVNGERFEPQPAAADLADVWGKDIIFAYRSRNAQRRVPSFAYTFRVRERRQDGTVNRWTEPDRHSDFFEVARTQVTHLVAPQAGFLVKTAIA